MIATLSADIVKSTSLRTEDLIKLRNCPIFREGDTLTRIRKNRQKKTVEKRFEEISDNV